MKSSFAFAWGPLLLTSMIACSGAVVPLGEIDQAVTRAAPVPKCEEPSGDTHAYESVDDAAARVAGTWYLCSGTIVSPSDTAGIEITGSQARFLVAKDGELHYATTDYDRTVEWVDATAMNGPGSYQLNLSTSTTTNMYSSRTSADGRFLELSEGTSGNRARYVRAKAAPPSCTVGSTVHEYTSVEDVRTRIAGKWSICSGDITSPIGTKGIELAPNKAYFLFDDGAGLARRAGWDYERDIEIFDTGAMGGVGKYQIDISDIGGSGYTNMYQSRISSTGNALELTESTSGKKVTYTRIQ